MLPFLREAELVSNPPTEAEEGILEGAVPIIKERLKKLSDAPELTRFLFREIDDYDPAELVPKKTSVEETTQILQETRALLDGVDGRDDEENETIFREKAEEMGVKVGNMLMPLRVALTGSKVSPPLFASIRLLGSEIAMQRVDRAIERIGTLSD